jgi:hypothetical protein
MIRKETQRLLRRFLMLAILTAGLTLAASGLGGNKAGAAICCNQCFANYDSCVDACGGNPSCEQTCYNKLVTCHLHCNPDC